jgi:hypothetical protein
MTEWLAVAGATLETASKTLTALRSNLDICSSAAVEILNSGVGWRIRHESRLYGLTNG